MYTASILSLLGYQLAYTLANSQNDVVCIILTSDLGRKKQQLIEFNPVRPWGVQLQTSTLSRKWRQDVKFKKKVYKFTIK